MKTVVFTLAVVLSLASFAHAETECAFGESSWQLKEELEGDAAGKIFYQGEHIDLSSPQRLKGLTAFERQMVLASYVYRDADDKTALLDFVSSDGYITYFTPNADRRQFAMVASYPGDNEYGTIFEITKAGNKQKFEAVANIGDGDFDECKVLKGQIK